MQDQEIRHQPSCEDELNIGLLRQGVADKPSM